jgi:hypothetical protein
MAIAIKDTLLDTSGVFFDAHTPSGTGATGGTPGDSTLPNNSHQKLLFTGANKVKTSDGAASGYISLYPTALAGDGQSEHTIGIDNTDGGNVSGTLSDKAGLVIGTDATTPQFIVARVKGSNGWRIYRVEGSGSLTNMLIDSANGGSGSPSVLAVPVANSATWPTGVHQVNIKILKATVNGVDHPRYVMTDPQAASTSDPSYTFDWTDLATAWTALGKYRGIWETQEAAVIVFTTSGLGTHGYLIDTLFQAQDYVALSSNTPVMTETLQQQIVISGVNMGWTTGSSPLGLTSSGVSGAAIVGAQTVDQAHQTVTLAINPGTLTSAPTPGTLTLTDTVTGATVQITVNPAALVLSGLARLIAGLETDALTLGLTPSGSTPAASTEATVTAKIGGVPAGTFPGSTDGTGQVRVVIGPHTTAVRIPYTADVNATPGSTVVFTVTASGFTVGTLSVPVLARATAIVFSSGPSGGVQDADSAPFTVALFPTGSGTPDGGVPFLMTDQDAGGFYDPPGGVLTTDSPSVPVVYHAPHGAATRLIGLTNSGGLVNPTPRSYVVTALGDYTISGPTDGPKDTASDVFTFELTNPTVTGDVHLPLDDGRQSGQQGTWHLLDGTLVTQLTLNYAQLSTRSVGVRYTPPAGYVSADAAGSLQLSATNDRGLQNAPSTPYQAWDPAVSGRVAVGADFGDGFSGQAATLGFVAWDLSTKQMVLDHPVGIISEVPGLGVYGAPAVLPLSFTGVIVWDDPDGYTGERFVQWIDMQAPVTPVLSPTDRANNQADLRATMQALTFAGDITTVAETLTNPLKAQLFAYYLLTNSTLDTVGNYIVRNAAGAIIQSLDGEGTVTLYVQKTGGLLTISPHRAS